MMGLLMGGIIDNFAMRIAVQCPDMDAIILSIGDELALGQTLDTNSAYLSARLAERGIMTRYHQTVADEQPDITRAIRTAAQSAGLVLITGGLGPTDDDLTRFALADAMGVGLHMDETQLDFIRSMMEKRGRTMAERNKVQAQCPDGATMITNYHGTAPGIRATIGDCMIYVLPGPPREMKPMYSDAVEPELPSPDRTILTCKINTFGNGESNVAELLGELCARDRNPLIGTTVSEGIVSVRIRSAFADPFEARQQLDDSIAQVEQRLGAIVYSREDESLAEATLTLLRERGMTIATAESCTGGLIGSLLTDIPGSSDVYVGGWVTYSNAMKTQQLGVDGTLIEQHGAVSEAVAAAMAQGALERSGADLAVSITGIAGPDGGSDDKPVGTVWIGIAQRGCDTTAHCMLLSGGRENVRDRGAKCALQLVRLIVLGESIDAVRWAAPKQQSRMA
jgi:nicotinamide-nucleotide amidase